MGSEALSAYATEVNQMVEHIVQVGNSRLGNDYIFAGTAVDTPPFSATRDANGDITAATYVGNTSQAGIPLSEVANVTPFTNPATNQGIGDMINRLVALRDALKTADGTAIGASQADLQSSEDVARFCAR